MQRHDPEGIIISCDFCATDWDQVRPMIEGHRGSVLCLDCLTQALDEAAPAPQDFNCTLCLQHRPAGRKRWQRDKAAVCYDCIRLAAKTFHKDPDVDFRWDPSRHPPESA